MSKNKMFNELEKSLSIIFFMLPSQRDDIMFIFEQHVTHLQILSNAQDYFIFKQQNCNDSLFR